MASSAGNARTRPKLWRKPRGRRCGRGIEFAGSAAACLVGGLGATGFLYVPDFHHQHRRHTAIRVPFLIYSDPMTAENFFDFRARLLARPGRNLPAAVKSDPGEAMTVG